MLLLYVYPSSAHSFHVSHSCLKQAATAFARQRGEGGGEARCDDNEDDGEENVMLGGASMAPRKRQISLVVCSYFGFFTNVLTINSFFKQILLQQ